MKQIFSAIAFLAMITLSKNSGAQSSDVIAFNNSAPVVNFLTESTGKTFETKVTHAKTTYLKATQVNIKAVRHFTRSYKNISDARWFKTQDGYIANFLLKGIDTRIVYDDNGRLAYNLLVYSEDKLPSYIRHRVKSEYYDDDITAVCEYEINGKTIYIISMKDQQSNVKILKVSDEEMEDITPHEKNN